VAQYSNCLYNCEFISHKSHLRLRERQKYDNISHNYLFLLFSEEKRNNYISGKLNAARECVLSGRTNSSYPAQLLADKHL